MSLLSPPCASLCFLLCRRPEHCYSCLDGWVFAAFPASASVSLGTEQFLPTPSFFFRRVLFTKVNSAHIAMYLKISMNLVYFHLQYSTSEWQLELNYTYSRNVLTYFQAVEKHLAGLNWVQTEP